MRSPCRSARRRVSTAYGCCRYPAGSAFCCAFRSPPAPGPTPAPGQAASPRSVSSRQHGKPAQSRAAQSVRPSRLSVVLGTRRGTAAKICRPWFSARFPPPMPYGLILGFGSDICDIRRIEHSLARFGARFTHRVFTRPSARAPNAGRSRSPAPREALRRQGGLSKALGTGFAAASSCRTWQSPTCPPASRPWRCRAAKLRLAALVPPGHEGAIHLTLTDEYPYAFAAVIITAVPAEGGRAGGPSRRSDSLLRPLISLASPWQRAPKPSHLSCVCEGAGGSKTKLSCHKPRRRPGFVASRQVGLWFCPMDTRLAQPVCVRALACPHTQPYTHTHIWHAQLSHTHRYHTKCAPHPKKKRS